MKTKISFHDQLGLNFETVPPCPSLEPPRRRNRRLGFFGRLFRRRLSHRPPNSNSASDYEPGSLVRYNPVLQ
jgi:hypothetical protein